jgi:Tfp pilus assembly protein PilZ
MDNLALDSKRKEMRIPYEGAVRFSADQFNWYLNNAQNISKKGIFIETDEAFTVGTKLYLNFDLTVHGEVVKKIRTIGEVVRLAVDEEGGAGNGSPGLGIHFSLLDSEETAMRAFVEDVVDSSLDGILSSGDYSAKHVCVEVQGTTASSLKWWLKELMKKTVSANGLIIELAIILFFIVLGVILFS